MLKFFIISFNKHFFWFLQTLKLNWHFINDFPARFITIFQLLNQIFQDFHQIFSDWLCGPIPPDQIDFVYLTNELQFVFRLGLLGFFMIFWSLRTAITCIGITFQIESELSILVYGKIICSQILASFFYHNLKYKTKNICKIINLC